MIKAVCFDLYNTLAYYDPPREEVHAAACRELGIEVEPRELNNSLPTADAFWRDENSRSPIDKRPTHEKISVYTEYEARALKGAGLEISQDVAIQILMKVQQIGLNFKLYDDALPALKLLKSRHLILGLISNVGQDIASTCKDLGLEPYLDFQVTSFEVGCDKPQPGMFLAALNKAQVEPGEAIYIGDQYDLDIVGARGVGMKAMLLDRNDSFTDITDCPRIRSLAEIVEYL
jgi:putative hydrolase of the HAD superfamily